TAAPVDFSGGVPSQIVFSAELGTHDGFVLYVNRIPAIASRLPAGTSIPGNLSPTDPRAGLAISGLSYQYDVPAAYFTPGENLIEVALYSASTSGGASTIDF